MVRLVALACGTGAYVVLDHSPEVGGVKVTAETVHSTLDAFVAVVVHGGDELVEEG
jgi:hypothetical protein